MLKYFARRFVAGETIGEVIPVVQELNAQHLRCSLDLLGEDVSSMVESEKAAQTYVKILEHIEKDKLNANVSLKLTQMGLDISEEHCVAMVTRVLEKARQCHIMVRIDMEGSQYTEKTIRVFKRLHAQYPHHLGLVIQAYLHRSAKDIEGLAAMGASVRICKGAYKEPANLAHQDMPSIRQNYRELTLKLLESNCPVGFATHDIELIDWMKALLQEKPQYHSLVEFQFLYGLRRTLSQQLAQAGHQVRIYIPFGTHWFPYFYRRLRERKENVFFVLKGLFTD